MLQVKLLCLCSMCGSSSITAVQSLCALDEVCQALWGVLLHFYDLWWSPEVLPHKARGGQLVSVDTDGFNMQTSWNQPYFRKLCLKPPGVCSPFFYLFTRSVTLTVLVNVTATFYRKMLMKHKSSNCSSEAQKKLRHYKNICRCCFYWRSIPIINSLKLMNLERIYNTFK